MPFADNVYGLTGGIASGKSAVAKILIERGAVVIDADELAREAVQPASPIIGDLIAIFGDEIIDEHGDLKRAALAERIFRDPHARKQLESIVHPEIMRLSAIAIMSALQSDKRPIFYDAALLVETGRYKDFAGLVVVSTKPETQLERLIKRDGLSEPEASERIEAQSSLEEKLAVADFTVNNDGRLEDLGSEVDKLLRAIQAREETIG